jgi:hypothetical protein
VVIGFYAFFNIFSFDRMPFLISFFTQKAVGFCHAFCSLSPPFLIFLTKFHVRFIPKNFFPSSALRVPRPISILFVPFPHVSLFIFMCHSPSSISPFLPFPLARGRQQCAA